MNARYDGTSLGMMLSVMVAASSLCGPCGSASALTDYRVFGRVIDGRTNRGLANVTVQFHYDSLASSPDTLPVLVTTNTDANGQYGFANLPGELEGGVDILELPASCVAPLSRSVRLSSMVPFNEVNFLAGPAAALKGMIVVTNGT